MFDFVFEGISRVIRGWSAGIRKMVTGAGGVPLGWRVTGRRAGK